MARARDFITDSEYDEALRRYYNGLDFTEHIEYKESLIDKVNFDPTLVEEYLEKEEEYVIIHKGYVITSYARVFNLRFRRFLKPKFYNSDIYIYCGDANYRLEPTFREMGWEFDKVEILRRYLENDWDRIVMENCRYAHLAE